MSILPNKPNTKNGLYIPAWASIIIILILSIFSLSLIFQAGQPSATTTKPNLDTNQIPAPKTKLYIGKIIGINKQQIKFKADAKRNKLNQDKIITAKFNDQTEFYFLIIPKKISADKEKNKIINKVTTSKNLKIGQTVLAYSSKNIYGQTSFTASKIKIKVLR